MLSGTVGEIFNCIYIYILPGASHIIFTGGMDPGLGMTDGGGAGGWGVKFDHSDYLC